jgi:hypothetical protein
MKVIGFSSGATGKEGNVDRMVQAVMDATGWDTQFVKLTDLRFTGCRGCVNLCAQPQVCMADDDLREHYERLMNSGKLDELEKVLDQAPEMLGETEAASDVYGQDLGQYAVSPNIQEATTCPL